MTKTICELFAGVGGFRLGFERLNSGWETVWFSQWEPGLTNQWAHRCYIQHFGDSVDMNGEYRTNEDISVVNKNDIPDHSLLVGGFPCQDYSVAQSLSTSKGIEGKKGVLWWQIRDVIIAKKPAFCILENVDRLLTSPASQYGRDFGIMLSCFHEQGYSVEWRVVRAARYGAPQRRNRTFIFAYKDDTVYGHKMAAIPSIDILREGFMAKAFPISEVGRVFETDVSTDIAHVSDIFSFRFESAGIMHQGHIVTAKITETRESPATLGSILEKAAGEQYYISSDSLPKWQFLKGAKKIPRVAKTGFQYIFSEGPMAIPDPLDRPGRTMLTSESTLNRSSHLILDPITNHLRVLTPIEAERLNGFDDDWTNTGMPNRFRYFCMGNALVVPMITRMGKVLDQIIQDED